MNPELVAQEEQKQYKTELLRSTAGAALNEKGFSTGTVQLKKGMIYDVAQQTISDVILLDGGQKIKVSKSDVTVTEDQEDSWA